MANRNDFTDDEWRLIIETPISVGYAVSTAERSGAGGQSKENIVMLQAAWLDPETEFARVDLIQDILAYRKELAARGLIHEESFEVYQSHSEDFDEMFMHALSVSLRNCKAVINLLEERVGPTEVEMYKIYVMSVADKVAKAAKEGGLFRKNDDPVSERERLVMEQLAEALNHNLQIDI